MILLLPTAAAFAPSHNTTRRATASRAGSQRPGGEPLSQVFFAWVFAARRSKTCFVFSATLKFMTFSRISCRRPAG
jgi:hypothetical protein